MISRILARPLLSGATTVLLLLTGCAGATPEGSSLSVVVVGEGHPDHGLTARLAAELTAATLIERDSTGQLIGGLASSWRFVDEGRVLILRLRPIKWSDGRSLVADDVVASYRRAAMPPSPAPGFRLAGVEAAAEVASGQRTTRLGILAPTSRVVELRLLAPAPQLLDWLAEPDLSVRRLDRPTLARYSRATDAKSQGVGAAVPTLVFKRRSAAESLDARPSAVSLQATADAVAAIADFRRGAADLVLGEGLTGLLEARVQGRREALRLDQLHGVYGWRVNTRQGALADPALRRLLAENIDRIAIARSFGLAAIQPEAGLLPASLRSTALPAAISPTQERTDDPNNPALAVPSAQAVAQAPLARSELPLEISARRAIVSAAVAAAKRQPAPQPSPDGAQEPDINAPLLTLKLLVPLGREHAQVAQRVATDWRALGVQIVLVEANAATRARLIARGDFDLAVDETSLAVPDPAALLDRFRCGQGPHCNESADALLAAARMMPADQRPGQIAIVESVLREGPPFIGLFGAVRWALVSPSLDGWVSNGSGVHPLGRIGRGRIRPR